MINAVIHDARTNGGKLKIGNSLYNIRPEFKTPLLVESYAPYMRAGAVGPDAFPSLLTGQTQIHTYMDKWLAYLDHRLHKVNPNASQVPLNAFYMGYLSHVCADMWTHDWVNFYAGGPVPSHFSTGANPAGIKNMLIHYLIEDFMDRSVSNVKSAMRLDIKVPVSDMVDLMINTKRTPVLADNERLGNADIQCADFLDDDFARFYWMTEQYLGAVIANPVSSYLKAWHADVKNGLQDMVTAHERAITRHLSQGEDMFSALFGELQAWGRRNILSMYGGPDILVKLPSDIRNALRIRIPFLDELKQKIKDNVRDYICQKLFGMTYSQLTVEMKMDALRNLVNDTVVYNKIMNECGGIPRFDQITDASNPIVLNSITFTKIAFLPVIEQRRLARSCGIKYSQNPLSVPYGVMNIHGSGQFNYGDMGFLTRGMLDRNVLRHFDPVRARSQIPLPPERRRRSSVSGVLKCVSVKVKTADKPFAGTNSEINFGLRFSNGTVKEWKLATKFFNDLERNQDDWYHFFEDLPNITQDRINQVSLRMVNAKGINRKWTCSSIRVSINGGPDKYFRVNKEFQKTGDAWSKSTTFNL